MIAALDRWALAYLTLALVQALLLTALKRVKYGELEGRFDLGLDDGRIVCALALGVTLPAALWPGLGGRFLGLSLGSLVIAGLWLDAVLFRVFTIELGPGGVKDVVVSVLARELAALERARDFFATHRAFAFLPLVAVLAQLGPLVWPIDLRTAPPGSIFAAATALSFLLVAASALRPRAPRSTDLRFAFVARPRPHDPAFAPRPEHLPLLLRSAAQPRPSAHFGRLAGQNVILLSFESLGRDHLDAFLPGGARAPFFESLLPQAVRSSHHFAISPLTNNAHTVIYGRNYGDVRGGLFDLRSAGYQSIYLTAARTRHYGLRALLEQAGFDAVIDGDDLRPHPLDGGVVSDHALLGSGLEQLEPLIERGPFFLHVHAANTHTPYRVVDRGRFNRFDLATDRGRFLDGIEETDWIFGQLVDSLTRLSGLREPPLLVVTSDHGQAFGELGYHSHGSAIVQQQLTVPLILQHRALAPETVRFSSHLDLLPTVLDLLGLVDTHPGFGESIFHRDRDASMLVWAGHPSRSSSTNFGLILEPDRKWMIDLIRDQAYAMDWNDQRVERLAGADRTYAMLLASRLMTEREVS